MLEEITIDKVSSFPPITTTTRTTNSQGGHNYSGKDSLVESCRKSWEQEVVDFYRVHTHS